MTRETLRLGTGCWDFNRSFATPKNFIKWFNDQVLSDNMYIIIMMAY